MSQLVLYLDRKTGHVEIFHLLMNNWNCVLIMLFWLPVRYKSPLIWNYTWTNPKQYFRISYVSDYNLITDIVLLSVLPNLNYNSQKLKINDHSLKNTCFNGVSIKHFYKYCRSRLKSKLVLSKNKLAGILVKTVS